MNERSHQATRSSDPIEQLHQQPIPGEPVAATILCGSGDSADTLGLTLTASASARCMVWHIRCITAQVTFTSVPVGLLAVCDGHGLLKIFIAGKLSDYKSG